MATMNCWICEERKSTRTCSFCDTEVCANCSGYCMACGQTYCDDCVTDHEEECKVFDDFYIEDDDPKRAIN